MVDNRDNEISGYTGHKYTVDIIGILSRSLNFSVDGTEKGDISGLKNGGSYSVRITNSDYLPDNPTYYLKGYGTITCI